MKETIFFIARLLFELAFICAVIQMIMVAVSLFKKQLKNKSRMFWISWIIALLLCIPHIPRLTGYEVKEIGHFYEADNYTAYYKVYMSRNPESKSDRKVYTLTAKIVRLPSDDYHEYSDYLGELHTNTITTLNYHIDKLYFPNGGYLSFDPDEPDDNVLKLNEEVKVTDYKGDDYYIKLTDKKSSKK